MKKATMNNSSIKSLNKKQNVSDIMINETRKMEEKLELVKKMMELEKNKRSKIEASSQGTMWRGATTKKSIKGYSESVVMNHKKTQPNLPPTHMVTETRSRIPSGAKKQSKKSDEEAKLNFVNQNDLANAAMGVNKITNNLMHAVSYQNEEYDEVRVFLEEIKLEKYFEKMIENGIEDLETILELKDDHVEQMGVPLGHKLKIIKRIKDMRVDKGMSVPQSREGTRKSNSETQDQPGLIPVLNKKQVRFGDEEKGDGKKESNNLADGAYDEAESHSGFIAALNAWRNEGKPKEEQTKITDKKVKLSDIEEGWKQQQDVSKKGSWFANIDANATDFDFESIPTWQEGGTQGESKSTKESCWQCFKLFSIDQTNSEFKLATKVFCSKSCFSAFNALSQQLCQLEECKNRFKKEDVGIFLHGRWYCSEEHANQDPQTIKMKQIELKIKNKAKVQEEEDSSDVEIDL